MVRNNIREVSSKAHLCPLGFRGRRSCWVNRLMNQFCRVSRRLSSHRGEGAGKSNSGRQRARATNGIPRKEELINWSKKFRTMVRLKVVS